MMQRRGIEGVLVTGLLALYWGMAVGSTLEKSATFDEPTHLTAGYSYWVNDDFRLNPEGGILAQYWSSLPLLLGEFEFPSKDQYAWKHGQRYAVAHQFLYGMGNDGDAMLFRARAMAAVLGVALGLVVFLWSKSLFGSAGGFVSLVLYTFSPTLLAHGRLVTPDVCLAFTLFASTWTVWRALHRLSWSTLGPCLAFTSLLWVSKMSALLMFPIVAVLLAVRLVSAAPLRLQIGGERIVTGRPQQAVIFAGMLFLHGLVGWSFIWGAYHFRFAASTDPSLGFFTSWNYLLRQDGASPALIASLRDAKLLPEAFLYGLAHVLEFAQSRPAFFNGEVSREGWHTFFPYAFLVKTPISLLLLLVLACGAWGFRGRADDGGDDRAPSAYELTPLLALLGVYWGAALRSHLNIGHRHLLPTYPVLFVLAGASAAWLRHPRPLMKGVVGLLLAAFAFESLWIRPHYLAYFNVIAGGPNQAYRHLVDSSLDWGQDLPSLKRWLDENVPAEGRNAVYLSYFGTGDPEHYGIRAQRLPGFFDLRPQHDVRPLRAGIYCISATMLQSVYSRAPGAWTARYESDYRKMSTDLRRFDSLSASERQALLHEEGFTEEWRRLLDDYEQFRLSKLNAYLRQRAPDHRIAHSILVFELSDADLEAALREEPGPD